MTRGVALELGTPCKDCKRPMAPKGSGGRVPPLPKGYVRHGGKGLCERDYKRSTSMGHEARARRLAERDEEIGRAWREGVASGLSIEQIAQGLGVTRGSLRMRVTRARRAGKDWPVYYDDATDWILEDWPAIRDSYPIIKLANGSETGWDAPAERLDVPTHTLYRVLKAARDAGDDRGNYVYDLRRSA